MAVDDVAVTSGSAVVVPGPPPVRVISGAGEFAIQADFNASTCTLEAISSDPAQQWQFLFFGPSGCAMVIDGPSGPVALAALPNVEYPQLLPFTWDLSYLWSVPPIGGVEGISTLRDGSFCLTIEAEAVQPGTRIQYYNWTGNAAQEWGLVPVI